MNVLSVLKERFRSALAGMADDPDSLLDMIVPAQDSRFGDYQANCAMPLGKRLGRSPREIAADIAEQVDLSDLCNPAEIAGPGFINLRLRDQWIIQQLETSRGNSRMDVRPVQRPRTFVIDFSSPNVAKPMHVGHIRSTVIGDALCRILRFAGHKVISDNHIGDWGTQFGMIIYGYRNFADDQAYQTNPVPELARVYRLVRQIMDAQQAQQDLPRLDAKLTHRRAEVESLKSQPRPTEKADRKRFDKSLKKAESQVGETTSQINSLRQKLEAVDADSTLSQLVIEHGDLNSRVLNEVAKLHAGDADNLKLWQEFLPHCRQEIQRIYDRMVIEFDHELGESFYHDKLPNVVSLLREKQLARESEGAMCIFLDDFATPMIVQKRDGAFLYATTDLATIQHRMTQWKPDAILYVVDFRQSEHFEKLFAAARLLGYDDVEFQHVSFGTVLGDDGRPFQTRAGDTVGLEGLLDEAERRAYDIVRANDDAKPNGAELSDERRRHIARTVGIAALKYADLSQNRTSDYVFSYDKMLSLTGNTATYMQYSYARIHGIFARGNVDIEELRASASELLLDHVAERKLGLELLRFSEALDESIADYRPNHLTSYLFELAKSFSTFFEECPVLRADNDLQRDSRLLICDLTARTIKQGLELLGIQVVEKM